MAGQGYDRNDFANMQREAERRVMEMQRRAKATVSGTMEEKPPTPPAPPPKPIPQKQNLLSMLNLKSFLEGKDTSLVLMVLALLSAEDTDPLLLLALIYVMM